MPTRRLTVSVPKPCHEDWNAMTPELQGRFCQSCSKTVVDFTAMSDAEVVQWLTKNKNTSCGRFSSNQLGKELIAATYNRKRWTWRAVALGLSAWLSTKNVEARNVTALEFEQSGLLSSSQNKLAIEPTSNNTRVVEGVIIDAKTKDKLPGVMVILKGTNIAAPTDINGKFKLDIPANMPVDKQIIVFSYIGYIPQERKASKLLKKRTKIALEGDTQMLGGIAIMFEKRASTTTFFHRIKHLFS